jgi:hypothetical protein
MFDNCQFSVKHNLSRTSQLFRSSNNFCSIWIVEQPPVEHPNSRHQLNCFKLLNGNGKKIFTWMDEHISEFCSRMLINAYVWRREGTIGLITSQKRPKKWLLKKCVSKNERFKKNRLKNGKLKTVQNNDCSKPTFLNNCFKKTFLKWP